MEMQPSYESGLATEPLTIRFVGDPVGADLLVFFLQDEGLQVAVEPPRDTRVFEGEVSVACIVKVSRDLAAYLTTDAINRLAQNAIDKVAARIPRVQIQIEDYENT